MATHLTDHIASIFDIWEALFSIFGVVLNLIQQTTLTVWHLHKHNSVIVLDCNSSSSTSSCNSRVCVK